MVTITQPERKWTKLNSAQVRAALRQYAAKKLNCDPSKVELQTNKHYDLNFTVDASVLTPLGKDAEIEKLCIKALDGDEASLNMIREIYRLIKTPEESEE